MFSSTASGRSSKGMLVLDTTTSLLFLLELKVLIKDVILLLERLGLSNGLGIPALVALLLDSG